MFCPNCAKLAFMNSNKKCIRCQGTINNNISVLCDFCSTTARQCSVCLKKTYASESEKQKNRGCNCGGK